MEVFRNPRNFFGGFRKATIFLQCSWCETCHISWSHPHPIYSLNILIYFNSFHIYWNHTNPRNIMETKRTQLESPDYYQLSSINVFWSKSPATTHTGKFKFGRGMLFKLYHTFSENSTLCQRFGFIRQCRWCFKLILNCEEIKMSYATG